MSIYLELIISKMKRDTDLEYNRATVRNGTWSIKIIVNAR